MSNSFEILMNQLGIPTEMRQAPALAQADIERVVVHKISKVWEFHFVFSNILPIEIFLELKKGLREEFSKTGNKAVFEIKALSQEFSNQLLQSYYREAFSEGPCASQGFKSLYQNLQVRAEGNQLFIEGSEAIDKEHFKKNHLPNLAKQLEKFGFPTFNCQVEKNDVLTQEQEEAFHAEMSRLFKRPMRKRSVLWSNWNRWHHLQLKRNQPLIFRPKRLRLSQS